MCSKNISCAVLPSTFNRLRQLGEVIKVLKRTTDRLDARQILAVVEQFFQRQNQITMDKYIFLDFDGVLNSGRNYERMAEESLPGRDRYGTLFDTACVESLRRIVQQTGGRIIVTSSWRYLLSLNELTDMWRERRLPGRLTGVLPTDMLGPSMPGRGAEIEEWFRRNRKKPRECQYVILDDEPGYLIHQQPHLVLTDPAVGLSPENAELAIGLLI